MCKEDKENYNETVYRVSVTMSSTLYNRMCVYASFSGMSVNALFSFCILQSYILCKTDYKLFRKFWNQYTDHKMKSKMEYKKNKDENIEDAECFNKKIYCCYLSKSIYNQIGKICDLLSENGSKVIRRDRVIRLIIKLGLDLITNKNIEKYYKTNGKLTKESCRFNMSMGSDMNSIIEEMCRKCGVTKSNFINYAILNQMQYIGNSHALGE